MTVRVRLQPPWKLFLGLMADLLILLGVAGVLVWLWGLSDGAVYQYAQGVRFSSDAGGGDFGIACSPAIPEASPLLGVSRLIARVLPKRDRLRWAGSRYPASNLP